MSEPSLSELLQAGRPMKHSLERTSPKGRGQEFSSSAHAGSAAPRTCQ
jgi:hypothetical protein